MYQLMRNTLQRRWNHITAAVPTRRYLRCWKCGANNETELICAHCNHVQKPPSNDNYFTVFSLNANYEISLPELTKRYRFMQSVLHPDKFSNKSEEEKQISETYSSLVNKAFKTLQAPLSRALHMLAINGVTIAEDNKATDANFLMEIMELNEQVEDASDASQLRDLNDKNDRSMEEITKSIAASFRNGHIDNARQLVIKLKYYNSLSVRINHLLRERGIID